MRLAIIPIGHSKGIRLPKAVLDKYRLTDAVEVEMLDGALLLKPWRKSREGWEDQFKQMHDQGDDKLILPDLFDDEIWEVW